VAVNTCNYDAIVVLGGGRAATGELSELSKQRLDGSILLVKSRVAAKIITLGGHYSVYSPTAVYWERTGAELSEEYVISHGIDQKRIIPIKCGRDTISEAFATRQKAEDLRYDRILLVTSDEHLHRALYIFRRIFSKAVMIKGHGVPSGNSIIVEEEAEYLKEAKKFFSKFPERIPMPNLTTWCGTHANLYERYHQIHDKYHPPGKESQAYLGI
jgi:uncharacterized SAM-binding protein YcdF (DUF218 family)